MRDDPIRRRAGVCAVRACAALLTLAAAGCFAPLKTVAARSAIEQELTSAAARRSLERLDLDPLDRTSRYRLEVAAPVETDLDVLRARLLTRLGKAGIRVVEEPDVSLPVLRATFPFAGVDVEAALLGVPLVVPGLPLALGDISLYRSGTLTGRARVELSVWTPDGAFKAELPASEASRYYRNVTLLTFLGPFRFTDLDEPPPPGSEP